MWILHKFAGETQSVFFFFGGGGGGEERVSDFKLDTHAMGVNDITVVNWFPLE